MSVASLYVSVAVVGLMCLFAAMSLVRVFDQAIEDEGRSVAAFVANNPELVITYPR